MELNNLNFTFRSIQCESVSVRRDNVQAGDALLTPIPSDDTTATRYSALISCNNRQFQWLACPRAAMVLWNFAPLSSFSCSSISLRWWNPRMDCPCSHRAQMTSTSLGAWITKVQVNLRPLFSSNAAGVLVVHLFVDNSVGWSSLSITLIVMYHSLFIINIILIT